MKFNPYKKGESRKSLGTESMEVVLLRELEVLAILNGGANSFHPLK